MAWLEDAHLGEYHDRDAHRKAILEKSAGPCRDYERRVAARIDATEKINALPEDVRCYWLSAERPLRADESEEPDNAP